MQSRAMREVDKLTLGPQDLVVEALAIIDQNDEKIALVTAHDGTLLGVITDGDIRRHLLGGGQINQPVIDVMNADPVVARDYWDQHSILVLMRARSLRQVPVVNSQGLICGIFVGAERIISARNDTPVLIMAGGFGTRLAPLTNSVPKPMLEIGRQPMLEIILKRLILQGFTNFYFALHYMPETIMSYFGSGAPWGCSIEYICEKTPLGTAGAVGLIPEAPGELIVTNGDVLTTLDYAELLDSHFQNKAAMTVCTRLHSIEVPFGVITQSENRVRRVVEKPVHETLINSGVYVLGQAARKRVPFGVPLLMTDLINQLVKARQRVFSFPTAADWIDVGRPADLQRVRDRAELAAELGWIGEEVDGAVRHEAERLHRRGAAEVR